jgi:Molydopterin dinucleotide binding domain
VPARTLLVSSTLHARIRRIPAARWPGSGESAHLPWLQAAPDPVTSVTWQTWVEVNPRMADALALHEGDVVTVRSTKGSIDVPVCISPAAPPEVLAIPLGQGHTGFGRWADGRGSNPVQLLAPLADVATGALAYGSTRVNLTKTGRSVALGKLEGNAPARQLPGQGPVASYFSPVPPVDFRSDRVRNRTDGQLFWIIANGLGNMPAFHNLVSESDLWTVVLFVRQAQQSQ